MISILEALLVPSRLCLLLISAGLECSDLAVHEYIGMMWYRMRGVI